MKTEPIEFSCWIHSKLQYPRRNDPGPFLHFYFFGQYICSGTFVIRRQCYTASLTFQLQWLLTLTDLTDEMDSLAHIGRMCSRAGLPLTQTLNGICMILDGLWFLLDRHEVQWMNQMLDQVPCKIQTPNNLEMHTTQACQQILPFLPSWKQRETPRNLRTTIMARRAIGQA